MGTLSKRLGLLLILMMAIPSLSLPMIKPAFAQSMPAPSVPTFSLRDTNDSVDMLIQNQPIIPNSSVLDNTSNIFWNIRMKSHDSQNWTYNTVPVPPYGIRGYTGETSGYNTTELQYPFSSIDALLGLSNDSHSIDYQVQSINGYLNTTYAYSHRFNFDPTDTPVVLVNTSDWSPTQTITIPASSVSPNPTSSVPELSWLAILPLLLSAFSVAVIVRHRKQVKKL